MGGIDVTGLRFGDPVYAWLALVPLALCAACIYHLVKRRETLGRLRHRELPVRERIALFGAWPFSFGHRHDAGKASFATLEAVADGLPVVGRFSTPRLSCGEDACGVEDQADSVRGMTLMAPVVASYRGPRATP